jgi:probable addiction module antidote protein
MTKIKTLDIAEFLDTPEVTALYLTEAQASGDSALVAKALDTIARAKSMIAITEKTGLSPAPDSAAH